MLKVGLFDTHNYDRQFFDNELKNYSQIEVKYFQHRLNSSTVSSCAGLDVVCCFVNDKIDSEVIEQLKEYNIKMIALRCAGFNNVDMDKAKELDIPVTRVPAYSPESVAEHALALLMTMNRKTHRSFNRIRELNFSLEGLVGYNVFGKTVGVIGTGKIGKAFCNIMLGMGCEVLAFDLDKDSELTAKKNFKYVELDNLLSQSDIISLHVPLNSSTKHIINETAFDKMKNGVTLVNTSRGGLVNTPDLIKALKSLKVGAACLDVYEEEEGVFFEDHSADILHDDDLARLLTFPNVLISSHQAFLTKEALTEIAKTTLNNISSLNK